MRILIEYWLLPACWASILLCRTSPVSAQSPIRGSTAYTVTSESLDSVGSAVSAGVYNIRESVGGITTKPAVSTPNSALYSYNGGFIGQSPNLVGFVAEGAAPTVSEMGSIGLRGWLLYSDFTQARVEGGDIQWAVTGGPVQASGAMAQAGAVFDDTPATLQASYGGQTATFSLLVRDSTPDNFGAYAGDGLPDSWQVAHFGLNNPLAAPGADASGTGQSNQFKYLAGLDPLDPAARFTIEAAAVPGQPGQRTVTFQPLAAGRTYTVEWTADPASGVWNPLASWISFDQGNARSVTDLTADGPKRVYRVRIAFSGY